MYYITITDGFSGAHSLKNYQGECANLHGHNWKVKVVIRCSKVNEIGISVDFKFLKDILKDVVSNFDHQNLNELDYFKNRNPSAENISKVIYCELKQKLPHSAVLKSVEVFESEKYSARYEED